MTISKRIRQGFSLFREKRLNKREEGNIVTDSFMTLLTMLLITAMILAMISYATMINKKIEIDRVVKNYLYLCEQEGYLSSANLSAMITDLTQDSDHGGNNIFCTNVTTTGTTVAQVSYGQPVTVNVTVTFDNPVAKVLNNSGPLSARVANTITYHIQYESVSRW